jgi:hypothetical protein
MSGAIAKLLQERQPDAARYGFVKDVPNEIHKPGEFQGSPDAAAGRVKCILERFTD